MLQTAYALPFQVFYPTGLFFSQGHDLTLLLRLHEGVTAQQTQQLIETVRLFVAFAQTGGLAGKRLAPWQSGLHLEPAARSRPGELTMQLQQCVVDEASLIALCDLFLHKQHAALLQSVELIGSGPRQALTCDTSSYSSYPEPSAKLPFAVTDEEPESGAYTFAVEFAEPLDAQCQAALQAALDTWVEFVLAGGFALAPIPPEDNYVEPDSPFITFDSTVEWSVFKVRTHPASIDALVNLFAGFQRTQSRARALTIS